MGHQGSGHDTDCSVIAFLDLSLVIKDTNFLDQKANSDVVPVAVDLADAVEMPNMLKCFICWYLQRQYR